MDLKGTGLIHPMINQAPGMILKHGAMAENCSVKQAGMPGS